jgi:hypothetical protein
MKNLISLFTALLLLSCGDNNSPQPPKGEDIDTVIPPPPKPIDSVPVVDPIIPPPPPVEDTIAPNPPDPPRGNNYTLSLNYYKIEQGRVSDEQALKNRFGLEQAIQDAKSVGIDTFKIGKVDVYFDVSTVTSETNKNFYPSVEGINIPSDFNLVMSDDTYLRVQPNNSAKYSLLVFDETKNSYVSGGHLVGERLEHTPSGQGSDEWGHLMNIIGGQDITIDNVEAKHGNGDGLVIQANEFPWVANYLSSKGILIKNSRFIENRRQGISITSTEGTIIDGCHFDRTGVDLPNSRGTDPKTAIDGEPYRERDKVTGEVHEYEKLANVIIRNCTEVGSVVTGFIFKAGDNILIENNTIETGINLDHVTNARALNNTFFNPYPDNNRLAIAVGSTSEFSHNNSASGNIIEGFSQGIRVGGEGSKVHGNKISDFISGIVIKNAINAEVYDNNTASERPTSIALFAHSTYAENVRIGGNYFRGGRSAAQFTTINRNGQKGKITVDNNTFDNTQAVTFDRVNNADFRQNSVLGAITVRMTDGLSLIENEVLSTSYGIQLREGNGLITIKDNKIPNAWGCVDVKVQPEELVREGNVCE